MGEDNNALWRAVFLVGAGIGLGFLMKKDPTPGKLLSRDGLRYLIEVIREWRPAKYNSEREYQGSLKQYLLGRFSSDRLRVESEYGFGKSRADIVIENEYGIEIKYNLHGESEIKRVNAQLENMKKQFTGSLLVLCGETGEDVFVGLKKDLAEEKDSGDILCDIIRIPQYYSD